MTKALGIWIEGFAVGEEGLLDLQLGKKDCWIYSWGRRIVEFSVGEEGLLNLQLGKKDRGDLQLGRTIGGCTVRKG